MSPEQEILYQLGKDIRFSGMVILAIVAMCICVYALARDAMEGDSNADQ